MEEIDPLASTKSACRSWLRYQDPENFEVRVKIAKYGEHRSGGLENEAAPLDALRSSQCWHAAHQLDTWLFDAAIYRRSNRLDSKVARLLWENHYHDWQTFVAENPHKPLRALLVDIADQMAVILGPDPF